MSVLWAVLRFERTIMNLYLITAALDVNYVTDVIIKISVKDVIIKRFLK